MKYIDILKAYFLSLEFEHSIIDLYNKKEKIDYIEEYINKALTYVSYFAYYQKDLKYNIKIRNNTDKSKILNNISEDEKENEDVEVY